ncbi:MAG TPA: hypothetical protein VK206_25305 [Anaerolineales bacterium]|nr:hypothetical protein [Anaerolineales bacterium]
MANEFSDVRAALARAVAERKISDDVIDMAAKQIATANEPIRGLDICAYGICIDYFLEGREWWHILPKLIEIEGGYLRGIEVFPWGIPVPDIFRVRVTHSLDVMPEVRV